MPPSSRLHRAVWDGQREAEGAAIGFWGKGYFLGEGSTRVNPEQLRFSLEKISEELTKHI